MSDGVVRMTDADVEDVLDREVPQPRWYLGVLGVDPGGGPTCWVMRRAPQS